VNYYELRKVVEKIIPRKSILEPLEKVTSLVKEKGRKVNYKQFNLETNEMVPLQRMLNEEEITNFLEVSLRAAYCPMPLNADVWDGLKCPYRCRYCYADSFRASLYTAFFDNSKTLGLRYCKPDFFKAELDNLLNGKGKGENAKAMSLRIPIRIGIRFEDFFPLEGKRGVAKELLKYLADVNYPVMINTKSNLVGREDYVSELARNKSGAAVHITMLSADDVLNRELEPGAPTFTERLQGAKALSDAGIRVVARIEPFMVFVNDEKDRVDEYCERIWEAGVRYITLDTYSYSANNPGIRRGMEVQGLDFERMFLLMSDAQWLGSLLLNRFTDYLREKEFKCSTFDFGSVPDNDDDICCCVDDWFDGGYNAGNVLTAVRYIVKKKGPVTWGEYESWVETQGGFLSAALRRMVYESWNLAGNPAYVPYWCRGIEPVGQDNEGRLVWCFYEGKDLREEMLESVLF